jgi:hypothetical protein
LCAAGAAPASQRQRARVWGAQALLGAASFASGPASCLDLQRRGGKRSSRVERRHTSGWGVARVLHLLVLNAVWIDWNENCTKVRVYVGSGHFRSACLAPARPGEALFAVSNGSASQPPRCAATAIGTQRGHQPSLACCCNRQRAPCVLPVCRQLAAYLPFTRQQAAARMGFEAVWNSHPKEYGKGGRRW